MFVTHKNVRLAYLLILGREAENSLVIDDKRRRFHKLAELRQEFISSYEFRLRHRAALTPEYSEENAIEVAPVQTVKKYFDDLKDEWSRLGNMNPYWSVLSSDEYNGKLNGEKLQQFYSSGESTVSHFLKVCEFNRISIPDEPKIIELGCGVGRITKSLASISNSILAVDVSPGNLDIARSINYGACEVNFLLLDSIDRLNEINGEFNIFFTVITLQHNPPSVQLAILKKIFSLFTISGSILYFQTVTHITERGRQTLKSFSGEHMQFNTYSIPMNEVLKCINEANLEIFDLYRDDFQLDPDFHSYSFFVRHLTASLTDNERN